MKGYYVVLLSTLAGMVYISAKSCSLVLNVAYHNDLDLNEAANFQNTIPKN
jgi:hypothetical protein